MGELKPCPCGAKAKLLETDGLSESYGVFNDVMYSKVICQQCSFSADDVEDWNNRASQSQWVSVDEFKTDKDVLVYAYCNDVVSGWVEHLIFTPDNELYYPHGTRYPAIVTHVQVIKKPQPPKEIDCENNSRSKRA